MKTETARKLTIKIMRIILEEMNGYSYEEIIKKKLAEECEGGSEFTRIHDAIINHKIS